MNVKRIVLLLSLPALVHSCNEHSNKENTTKDTAATATSSSPGEKVQPNDSSSAQTVNIDVRVFQSGDGWGYDIYMNEKMYVHQPHIPAVSGNHAFRSENDARKAGELMVYKIRNNVMPPSITIEELDSIGIQK